MKKLWTIFNSSFIIWCLSYYIVDHGARVFAQKQQELLEQIQKSTIENRLNNEISYRVSEALIVVELREKQNNKSPTIYGEACSYLNNNVLSPQGLVDLSRYLYNFSISVEYQTRRFDSLIFELKMISGNQRDREKLNKAQEIYKSLEHLSDTYVLDKSNNNQGNEAVDSTKAKLISLKKLFPEILSEKASKKKQVHAPP